MTELVVGAAGRSQRWAGSSAATCVTIEFSSDQLLTPGGDAPSPIDAVVATVRNTDFGIRVPENRRCDTEPCARLQIGATGMFFASFLVEAHSESTRLPRNASAA
jgi:hypothetical protein